MGETNYQTNKDIILKEKRKKIKIIKKNTIKTIWNY